MADGNRLVAGRILLGLFAGCAFKATGCNKETDAPSVARPSTTRPVVPDDVPEVKNGIPADLEIIPELGIATAQKMGDGEVYQKYKNGLLIFDIRPGVGRRPQFGETVHVTYKGMFPGSDKVFDSNLNKDHPFEFRLGTKGIIKGWNLGVLTMAVGTKRRLWLPADLAYGVRGNLPTIPPNSPLIFEIELLSISGEAVEVPPAATEPAFAVPKVMGPAAPSATSPAASEPAK